jgi:ribose transport system substrate-binding protein
MTQRTRISSIAATVLVCTALLATASCGSSNAVGGSKKTVRIVMVQGVTGLPFAQLAAQGGKDAAAAVGNVDFSVAGPANIDPPTEAKIFQQIVATKPDGIALHELPPDLFTRLVKDATQSGITVLPYTIAPAADSTSTTFVGDDGVELGRTAADRIAAALIASHGVNVRGQVITGICVPGLSVLTQRLQGVKEELAKKLPNVTVLDPFDSKTDPAQDYVVWQQAAAAHPDALAMVSPCEADNENLTKIKRDSHASWLVVSFDIDEPVLQGIKDGTVLAIVPLSSYVHGYVATRLLAQSLQAGKNLPAGWVRMPIVPIDSSNVDAIITRESSVANERSYWKPYIDKIFATDPVATLPLTQASQ